MKRLHKLIVLGACGAFLLGCGAKEAEEAPVVDVDGPLEASELTIGTLRDRAERARAEMEIDIDPCALLSDDFIRGQFESATNVNIDRRLSDYSVHPMCVVSWPKPNKAEIEANTASAMSDYLARKMRGEDVKMPAFATEDEITLTLFQPEFEDNAAAIASFDRAMAVLKRGVTGSAGGVEVSFQSDVVPVDGVGDKATWAVGMRQISVVHGRRIYYITVNTGAKPSVEEAQAIALAKGVGKLL